MVVARGRRARQAPKPTNRTVTPIMPCRRALAAILCAASLVAVAARAQPYGDWHSDAPAAVHRILPADLPPPDATRSAANVPRVVPPPPGAMPRVPPGFSVQRFAAGLTEPRIVRVA